MVGPTTIESDPFLSLTRESTASHDIQLRVLQFNTRPLRVIYRHPSDMSPHRQVAIQGASCLLPTGHIIQDRNRRQILLLFQSLVPRLHCKASPWMKEQEDTFAHTTMDLFWTHVFHHDSEYTFGWANEVDEGSGRRRGDGLKPDGYLNWQGHCFCVMEIKSPKQAHNSR